MSVVEDLCRDLAANFAVKVRAMGKDLVAGGAAGADDREALDTALATLADRIMAIDPAGGGPAATPSGVAAFLLRAGTDHWNSMLEATRHAISRALRPNRTAVYGLQVFFMAVCEDLQADPAGWEGPMPRLTELETLLRAFSERHFIRPTGGGT